MAELHEILDGVRRDGLAENDEDTAVGLYTASVPVVNEQGTVLAAVTVSCPRHGSNPRDDALILDDLVAAGHRAVGRCHVAPGIPHQAPVTVRRRRRRAPWAR